MSEPFVHQIVADDGVAIVGSVEGQGPPLVVVPATASDQPVEWEPLAPHLTEHFTCYVMDRSSRARHADEPDHSFERLVGDVVAFVESVGEPAGLFGMSWGGILSVGAAQRTAAVSALGLWEPLVIEAATDEDQARFDQVREEVGRLVDEGRLVDAVRLWNAASGIHTEEDLAATPDEVFEGLAPAMAIVYEEWRQAAQDPPDPTPSEPSELAALTVPVLLMYGAESVPLFVNGVEHVAEHVTDATVRSIPGVGHAGGILAPEPVAQELADFFTARLDPR
jgi:pimeloyl-ACP methyl ester carboxylesterase